MGPEDGVGSLNFGDPLLCPLAGHTDASRLGLPQRLSEGRESEVTYSWLSLGLTLPLPFPGVLFVFFACCVSG